MPTKKATKKAKSAAASKKAPAQRSQTLERRKLILDTLKSHGPLAMRDLVDQIGEDYARYARTYNVVRALEQEGLVTRVRDGSRTPLWYESSQAPDLDD